MYLALIWSVLSVFFLLPLRAFELNDWQSITYMNSIRDISIDDAVAWVATSGGMYRYDPESGALKTFHNVDGLLSSELNSIVQDDHGHIICGGPAGILEIYDRERPSWNQLYALRDNNITDMVYRNDTLWVAAGKGVAVFIWEGNRYFFLDYFRNFDVIPTQIHTIALFNGRIWLGTDRGLFHAPNDLSRYTINDPKRWTIWNGDDGLASSNVLALAAGDQRLWVGTALNLATVNAGLELRPQNLWGEGHTRTVSDILLTDEHIYIANNYYSSAKRRFIARLYQYESENGHTFIRTYTASIGALAREADHTLWVGMEEEGLFRGEQQLKIDSPGAQAIRYVMKDSRGRIWASNGKFKSSPNKGFYIFDGNRWTNFTFTSGYKFCRNTTMFYEDRFQNVWLGSWGGGLMVYHNNQFDYFHNYDDSGLIEISDKDTVRIQELQPLSETYQNFFSAVPDDPDFEVVPVIKEGPAGNLWISNYFASNGNYLAVAPYGEDGFISLDKSQWSYFGIQDGITPQEGSISAITFDDFGRVWLGTFTQDKGIYILDYNGTITNRSDDQLFELTVDDNLWSNEILSLASDQDGVIWIGTRAGLNSFDGVNVYRHIKQVGDEEGTSGPLENQINQIVVDDYNNKWFATTGGVSILRGDRSPWDTLAWKGYHTGNSNLLDDVVHSIYVDSKASEALIGTEKGLSVYSGSFAEIEENFSEVIGGPNPFVLGKDQNRFTLTHLKANSSVKIFTLNGTLVRTLQSNGRYVDGSRAVWNGKDNNGQTVASGIYIYMAYTQDGETQSGKIAVIRQ